MRVAIAALGTRGDVLPFVVLGRALREAGHDVLVSTMERFRGLVEGASLGFHLLPGDPADVFAGERIEVSPWRPLQHLERVHAAVSRLVDQVGPDHVLRAWGDRDCVILTSTTTFSYDVAQELGARCAAVVMTPAIATGAFAHPVLTPGLQLGRQGNIASWLLAERLTRQTFKEPLRPAARRARGLPAFALATDRSGFQWPPFPLLHAFSPQVVPRPTDWPARVSVTGWLLPELSDQPLPDYVERFLAGGPAPLYVGFGSMPIPDPDGLAETIVAALRRTGQRAIVCGPALARAPALQREDSVLTADELPHERLLHRVGAIVHHGGSGSVGAALRSGRPTVVIPFVFDQFFWGWRVARLGAGPRPLPFRRLSADRLTEAVSRVVSGRYEEAARRLGELISAEDATLRAVAQIEGADL
ncbi:MAG: glycosyltransferase [Solirubrobacteraceae bacterium]